MSDTCDSLVAAQNILKSRRDSSPKMLPSRKQLDRTNSFGKFVTTYNIICAQNILFLPNLLNWLKTPILQNYIEKLIYSLKSLAFKCSVYVAVLLRLEFEANTFDVQWNKLFGRITSCFVCVRQQNKELKRKTSDVEIVKEEDLTTLRNRQLRALFEPTKKVQKHSKLFNITMMILVYFSVCFVFMEMFALLYALSLCPNIPWGMAFLLIAALSIVTLAFLLMKNPVVKKKQSTVSSPIYSKSSKNKDNLPTTSIPNRKFDFTEKTISKIRLF